MTTELKVFPSDTFIEYFQILFKLFNKYFQAGEDYLKINNTLFICVYFFFHASPGTLSPHLVPYVGLEALSRGYEDLCLLWYNVL